MRMAWAVFTHCCDSGRPFRHHPQRRCLHPLLQSVYHVAYLRGLFPEKTFKGMRTCSGVWQGCAATYWIPVCEELPAWPPPAQMGACPHLPTGVDMQNLDGLHIKMLDRRQENEEARRLIDWVEGGGCRKQCGAGARGLAHLSRLLLLRPPFNLPTAVPPPALCAPPAGVVDAIRKKYLKKLFFGISQDEDAKRLLEEVGGWLGSWSGGVA